MNLRKKDYIINISVGSVFYLISLILPIYFSLPKFIYTNIISSVIVSATLGPIIGILFTVFLSLCVNSIGFGAITYVFIIKAFESFLVGIINLNHKFTFKKAIITTIILSILVKPFSIIIEYIFNKTEIHLDFSSYFITSIKEFIFNNLTFTSEKYLFSCIIAFLIIHIINKFINKKGI